MKVLTLDNKTALFFFGFIAIMLFLWARILEKEAERYTPYEYVTEIHKVDSICISQEEPKYAEVWLKKKLKKETQDFEIEKKSYDKNAKAYRIDYKFWNKGISDERLTSDNAIYKTVWIKMNFKINDGDYKISPEIIKTKVVISKKKD